MSRGFVTGMAGIEVADPARDRLLRFQLDSGDM
eukprot:gene22749-biopygen8203